MQELTGAQKRLVDIVKTHDCIIYGVDRGTGDHNHYLEDYGSRLLSFRKREKLKPKIRKINN